MWSEPGAGRPAGEIVWDPEKADDSHFFLKKKNQNGLVAGAW